ncbi:MAG: ABC transporter substrate-binding protein [Candidatus Cloacimonetes bacterium]|nr:ABC transporter substrate-binding protein [Candidatus Cloacimonadota bacterium]
MLLRQINYKGHLFIRSSITVLIGLSLIFAASCLSCQKKASPEETLSYQEENSFTPRRLHKVRYTMKWLHQAQFAGAYMAKEKGFFQQYGLDVEIIQGGVDNPPYKALINGKTEFCCMNLITAVEKNNPEFPLVNLAQISQKNSTWLIGKKNTSINNLQDLNHRKVGIWRDEAGDHIRYFLHDNEIQAQIIPLDWSVNLFLNDAIDMMNAMSYNEYHRILMAGIEPEDLIVFNLSDYGYDLVDDGIYTSRAFYNRYPDLCKNFAKAMIEGWIYALDNPDETIKVVVRYMRENHLPANYNHQSWMLNHMRERVLENPENVGYLNPTDYTLAVEILMKNGKLAYPVEYEDFFIQ